MRSLVAACSLLAVSSAAPPELAPRLQPLPVGSITPKEWLLKQLTLQAEGLSGHLSQFWPDVMSSIWIGGTHDPGLHERTPYWLNGVVPLSYLLKNAGVELLPGSKGIYKAPWGVNSTLCTTGTAPKGASVLSTSNVGNAKECWSMCVNEEECEAFLVTSNTSCSLFGSTGSVMASSDENCYGQMGVKPVNVTAQVEKYVSYVLSHQASNGWLGPDDNAGKGGQYWGPSNMLFSLIQYAEGNDDGTKSTPKFKQATSAVFRHLMQQQQRMKTIPMTDWAQSRWIDIVYTCEWMIDNAGLSSENNTALYDLSLTLQQQGLDWNNYFETFEPQVTQYVHNVNNAQALKSAAVQYRYNTSSMYKNYTMADLSRRRMENLDARVGLPTGMFIGDEWLPPKPLRSPSRGIELCGVVEAMFSYGVMFSIHGDPVFADRAERIAYNALPATWASPTGGDMWAHQYLQAINEINAIKADPHVWTHDGDMAETYGLAPNYGCCTANFNQGWPKFAHNLIFIDENDFIVIGMYAPVEAVVPIEGHKIIIDTNYPFDDIVKVTFVAVKTIQLKLRIPGWATTATVDGQPAANGTFFRGTVQAHQTKTFTINMNSKVRIENRDNGAVAIHHGALMYSLPIQPNYTVYGHHFGSDTQSNDYYLNPISEWRYVLDVDSEDPSKSFQFVKNGYQPGTAPFNHTGWPTSIKAVVRQVPESVWNITANSASVPPTSPVCVNDTKCDSPKTVTLVPHGGTELRIGEFPVSGL